MKFKKILSVFTLLLLLNSQILYIPSSFAEEEKIFPTDIPNLSQDIKQKIYDQKQYLEEIGSPKEYLNTQIQWDIEDNMPSSIRGISKKVTKDITTDTKEILKDFAPVFGVNTEQTGETNIEIERQLTSKSTKERHVKFTQEYKGLQIVGGDIISHINKKGILYQINGILESPNIEITPKISAKDALDIAFNEYGNMQGFKIIEGPELIIFKQNREYILAYQYIVEYEDEKEGVNQWKYYIDAKTGKKLLSYNRIHDAFIPTQISGNILPEEGGAQKVITGSLDNMLGEYYLRQSTPLNQSYFLNNLSTNTGMYFDANDWAYRLTNDWGQSDPIEFSAAYNMSKTLEFYKQFNFGITNIAFDNTGTISIPVNVHYGNAYNNAFWRPGVGMYFGDGDGINFKSFAVLDVVGHEFSHAWTENTSDLIYYGEAGALNESFSDIMGTNIEFFSQPRSYAYPNTTPGTADWLLGEDMIIGEKALRDMKNPANTQTVGIGNEQPTRYKGQYWYFGIFDNGGVHYNSSIQNFFYYLLTEGGQGNNEGILYSLNGIGIENAAKIAYETNTYFMPSDADYSTARQAWIDAANSINPLFVDYVKSAWDAVGVPAMPIAPLVSAEESFEGMNAIPNNYTTLLDYGTGESWQLTNSTGASGIQSLVSGKIEDSSATSLTTSGYTDGGYITFQYRTSSEIVYDKLQFYIDGALQNFWSGETPWTFYSQPISQGNHTYKWQYKKDILYSGGLDEVGIDNVHMLTLTGTSETSSRTATGYYINSLDAAFQLSYSGGFEYVVKTPLGNYMRGIAEDNIHVPLAGLSEGSGSISFQFKNAQGFLSQIFTHNFFVDSFAPTSPEILSIQQNSYKNSTNIPLEWSPSSDQGAGLKPLPYTVYVSTGSNFESLIWSQEESSTGVLLSLNTDGTYYTKVESSDLSGNKSVSDIITFTIDTLAPNIIETTPVTSVNSDTTPSFGISATETGGLIFGGSCSSSQTGVTVGVNEITLDTLTGGTYGDCSLQVQDMAGNISNIIMLTSFTIDIEKPIIYLNGEQVVNTELGQPYVDPGALALDNLSGDVSSQIIATHQIDINRAGSYIIKYNVSDQVGNQAIEVTRIVNVVDSIAPVINIDDDVSSQTGNLDRVNITALDEDIDVTSLQYAFSDDDVCNENDIYEQSFTSGEDIVLDKDVYNGKYVCFKAADMSSNTSYRISSNPITLDSTGPILQEITRISSPSSNLTPSYVFSSNEAGSLSLSGVCTTQSTGAIVGENTIPLNTLTGGIYNDCSLSVVDVYGNVSIPLPLSSFIIDTTPPVLSFSGISDIQVVQGTYYIDTGVFALDSIDGDISSQITMSGSINTLVVGTYEVQYMVSDASGNQATPLTRFIQVIPKDTTPDAFDFTDKIGVSQNAEVLSDSITITGINAPTEVSMTGGTFSINGSPFISGTGIISNGNTLTLKLIAGSDYSETSLGIINIGGIEDMFTVVVMDQPVQSSSSGGGGGGWGGSSSKENSGGTNVVQIVKKVVGQVVDSVSENSLELNSAKENTSTQSSKEENSNLNSLTKFVILEKELINKNPTIQEQIKDLSRPLLENILEYEKIRYLENGLENQEKQITEQMNRAIETMKEYSSINIKESPYEKLRLKIILERQKKILSKIASIRESYGPIESKDVEGEQMYYISYSDDKFSKIQKSLFRLVKQAGNKKQDFISANRIVQGMVYLDTHSSLPIEEKDKIQSNIKNDLEALKSI